MFIIIDYVLVIELPQFHLFFTTFDFSVLNAAFDLIIHLIFDKLLNANCDATGSAPEFDYNCNN